MPASKLVFTRSNSPLELTFGIIVNSSLNITASSTRATLPPTFGTASTREVSVVVGVRKYSRLNSLMLQVGRARDYLVGVART